MEALPPSAVRHQRACREAPALVPATPPGAVGLPSGDSTPQITPHCSSRPPDHLPANAHLQTLLLPMSGFGLQGDHTAEGSLWLFWTTLQRVQVLVIKWLLPSRDQPAVGKGDLDVVSDLLLISGEECGNTPLQGSELWVCPSSKSFNVRPLGSVKKRGAGPCLVLTLPSRGDTAQAAGHLWAPSLPSERRGLWLSRVSILLSESVLTAPR